MDNLNLHDIDSVYYKKFIPEITISHKIHDHSFNWVKVSKSELINAIKFEGVIITDYDISFGNLYINEYMVKCEYNGGIKLKLGQAIDEIISNKHKIFKGGPYELYWDNKNQNITAYDYLECVYYNPLSIDCINFKWELIQSSVPFMDAVKSGRKIKVKHEHINSIQYNGYYHIRRLLEKLAQDFGSIILADIIKDGEFYIKDDN